MARVTVEDCIVQVPNRFELVMFAAQRARDISAGAQITLDRDRDKNPVVALREIAETKLDQAVKAGYLPPRLYDRAMKREQLGWNVNLKVLEPPKSTSDWEGEEER